MDEEKIMVDQYIWPSSGSPGLLLQRMNIGKGGTVPFLIFTNKLIHSKPFG
jgi:hypothetical protein